MVLNRIEKNKINKTFKIDNGLFYSFLNLRESKLLSFCEQIHDNSLIEIGSEDRWSLDDDNFIYINRLIHNAFLNE